MNPENSASHEVRMTTHCPDCGELDLSADQLWLVLTSAGRAHYDFICPECGRLERRPITLDQAAELAPYLAVEELDVPAEALEIHDDAPLTLDDLIDLMADLERPLSLAMLDD